MSKTILKCEGMVCPMPVAKTKRKLRELNSGDILEITGDFAEASENIKRFVEKQGHKVLEHKIEGENYHLKVKKA
ncbi:MAG: sulfurtransferase TusA family protein [Promethearchaeati archaeon]